MLEMRSGLGMAHPVLSGNAKLHEEHSHVTES